jgi:hypothetical protein
MVASRVAVALDPADAPGLVGGEIDNRGVAWFTRSTSGWQREMVSPLPVATNAFYDFAGAAFAGDGQPRIVYGDLVGVELPLMLAKRSPTSGWSSSPIGPSTPRQAGLVADTKGRARVVFNQMGMFGSVLEDQPEGTDARVIDGSSDGTGLVVAAGLNGTLAAAQWSSTEINLVISDGETAARKQTSRLPLAPTSCPWQSSCQSGTCTMDQVFGELAITSTSDGAFWLAYGVDHIDQDVTASYTTGEAHICQTTFGADRTTGEVVLMRVVPGDSTSAAVRWRVSKPPRWLAYLALSARGDRLDLAISDLSIRTFALDWQKL